jgi:predicted DNA-binding transcriptional regulator AlpA
MSERELLTSAQVLELLQIGRTKLWELVRAGAFPAFRLGEGPNASLRYRRDDVLRWLECNRVIDPEEVREAAPAGARSGER